MQIESGLEEESELRVKLHKHANTLGQLMSSKGLVEEQWRTSFQGAQAASG